MRPDRADHGYGREHGRGGALHDWRLKAAVQTALGWLPGSHQLNFLLQKHVTRTLPISDAELAGQVEKAQRNVAAFKRLCVTPLSEARFYEYGVGWDLLMPLVYYSFGVGSQTVIDLRPLARVDLVIDVARRLRARRRELGLERLPVVPDPHGRVSELVAHWGIEYRAPADARSVALPDASLDMVSSCDVLEHVPLPDVTSILLESRRILRNDGIMRLRVDYQDHYWYFDERVGPFNFLRYEEGTWARLNPGLHYQSRLRHDELLGLIRGAGWQLIEDDHPVPTPDEVQRVARMPLASRFRGIPPDRLAIRFANLSLAKSDVGTRRSEPWEALPSI